MKKATPITNLPGLINEKHLPSLDGLRAFSIIMVIVHHFSLNFPGSFILKLSLGGFGVNIFFVISGFLITFLLLKEKAKNKGYISLRYFYARRVLRIIPVAYLFILGLVILKYVCRLDFEAGNLARAMFFCENMADHPVYTSTGHYWSLSVEEQFYLLFPFVLTMGNRLFLKIAAVLFLVTPVIVYANYHVHTNVLLFKNTLYILNCILGKGMLGILTGCVTAILFFKFPDKLSVQFKNATLVQLGLLIMAWVFNIWLLPAGVNIFISSVCIALLLITVVNNRNNIVFTILNFKPVSYIGTLSYSLYIWQQIFTFRQPWADSLIPGKSILLNMILLLVTAMVSYHLYEKQFLKIKDKLFKAKDSIDKLPATTLVTDFENDNVFAPKL